jgi:8-oxo-dGTP pyrophosphatase MutT (NUDIX family)
VGRTRHPQWIEQRSAGGVVVRNGERGCEFLAIKPAHRNRWQLPKGTIDKGESPTQTAVREVREEGGVHATIVEELGPIRFRYHMDGRRFVKTVTFYLMTYVSGDPSDHDHEVQDVRWFPLSDWECLAFPTERGLVKRSADMVDKLTVETVASD